jgi:hypothetical protein
MKQETKPAAIPAELRTLVRKACNHMGSADAVIAKIHDAYVVPMIKPDGTIDTKSPALMTLRKQVRDVVALDWFCKSPRICNGELVQPAALLVAYKSGKGALYDAISSGIRVKAWRIVGERLPKPAKEVGAGGQTKQVETARKRSAAAKGKASAKSGKPAATQAPVTVPQLVEALSAAMAALKPQARIVTGTQLVATVQGWVNSARSELDGKPRKPAKPRATAKAATQAAPAAVQ